jgi:hypothetical protein
MQDEERLEIKEILTHCYLSTRVCASTIFPDRFYLPFYKIHDPLFAVLDDPTIQRFCITAPRGFGKTSIMNLAYPAKKILFNEKKFIVPISNSATQALMQSENLKRELFVNKIVSKIFGPIKSSEPFDAFTKDMWVTSGGTLVFPRGSGQQVRGILHGDSRPDLILCDDLENPEGVRNEEQRKKMKEWFFADVMGSTSRNLNNWQIGVMGTILHEDSLLANLMEDENWVRLNIELCDDKYNSLWPEFITTEEIKKLADTYRTQGLLDVFFREYRNLPISTEDATFSKEFFRYYEETPEMNSSEVIENMVIVDPAKTVKKHSDFSAIVGIGVNLTANRIYLRDCVAERMHPDRIYDEAFKMAARINASVIGLKSNSLNEFITYPMKNEMMRLGINLELVEIPERASKDDRIASLVTFYRRGLIFHNKVICLGLEAQLLSFPRSKRSDIMDAFADVIWMLENGERYFNSPSTKVSKAEDNKMKEMLEQDKQALLEEFDSETNEDIFDFGDDAVENWNRGI